MANPSTKRKAAQSPGGDTTPKKKFIRTQKPVSSAKKISKANKKKADEAKESLTPCLNAIQFKCASLAFDPIRFRKEEDGTIVESELFHYPIIQKIQSGEGDFTKKSGVHYTAIRCDENHKKMLKVEGSQYGFGTLISLSDKGILMDEEDVTKATTTLVDEWNILGGNMLLFKHPSKVRVGTVTVDEESPPTLDTHVTDRDVIEIMKVYYEINNDQDLLVLAEDEEIVSTYFEDPNRGAEVIKLYVNQV